MVKEKNWKPRTIRMSDELWFKIMQEAGKRGMDIAEFIRFVIEKELDND